MKYFIITRMNASNFLGQKVKGQGHKMDFLAF